MSAGGGDRAPSAATAAPPASWKLALGKDLPPERIRLADREYVRERMLHHGFFTAVVTYVGAGDRVVLKLERARHLWGVPLAWLGRLAVRQELAAYSLLGGIDGIPACRGAWSDRGLVLDYVPGRPLARGERLPASFFHRLEALVDQVHQRGVGHCDLSKRENVLVADDGHPVLIDFQIAWLAPPPGATQARYLGRRWPRALRRRILAAAQSGDRYHVLKHRLRSESPRAGGPPPPPLIAWHRSLSRPYHLLRRLLRRRRA